MKQSQNTRVVSEEAVAYSLARGKTAAVTRDNGEVAACSRAHERRRRQSLALDLGRSGTERKHRNRC